MRPFIYTRPTSITAAVTEYVSGDSEAPTVEYLVGGTTLIDLMKLDVMQPAKVIDLNAIGRQHDAIEITDAGLRLGAFAKMSRVADHADVARHYPVIVQSLARAASAQLRNIASLGGNVLQRTRCIYFRDPAWTACNKRAPGSGCAALGGIDRQHAVLGTSPSCIATYHGDFAQALIALEASVEVIGRAGRRNIPFARLHRLPGSTPHIETTLRPGEIITALFIPAAPWAARSLYLKVRDRQSYEFALASAAVALDLSDRLVREARIALGGLATVPWRAAEAEAFLRGKRLDEAVAAAAARHAFAKATPQSHNGFKIALGQSTLIRALLQAADMEI